RDRQAAADRPYAWARLVCPHQRSVPDGADQLRRLERRQAMNLSHAAIAICLMIGLAIRAADAAEPPLGSKNFRSPGSVPNYFSNEAAPFVPTPNAHAIPAEPAPAAAAPTPAPERETPIVVSPYPRQPAVRTVTTVQTSRDRQGRTVRTVTVRRYQVAAAAPRGRASARAA